MHVVTGGLRSPIGNVLFIWLLHMTGEKHAIPTVLRQVNMTSDGLIHKRIQVAMIMNIFRVLAMACVVVIISILLDMGLNYDG